MSTTDIPTKPITSPMRSSFSPLPTFDVIVVNNLGESMAWEWTDGINAIGEFRDICEHYDNGGYRSFVSVRVEFNGTVFRERVFASADK